MKFIILVIIVLFNKDILENHWVTLKTQNLLEPEYYLHINFQLNYLTDYKLLSITIQNKGKIIHIKFSCNEIFFNGVIKYTKISNYKKKICEFDIVNYDYSKIVINYYYKNKLFKELKIKNSNYNSKKDISIAWFGDHDYTYRGIRTIEYLEKNNYDFVFHLGDMAYNIYTDNFKKGDLYFNKMKKVMSQSIFWFTPGNHEYLNNTNSLNHKFKMPYNTTDWENINGFKTINYKRINELNFGNNLYSYVIKNTFFIVVNWDILKNEINIEYLYNWVKHELDIIKLNNKIKFKVFLSHRPFFCSKIDEFYECYRNIFYFKPIFDLIYEYKFNLVITAHIHFFETTKKINRNLLLDENNGINYFIVGSGGTTHEFGKVKPFKIFFIKEYQIKKVGVLRLIINDNNLTVYFQKFKSKFYFIKEYKLIIDYAGGRYRRYLKIFLIILLLIIVIIVVVIIYKRCKGKEKINKYSL